MVHRPGVQGTAERTRTLRNRRAERGQQRPRHPGQHQRDQGGYRVHAEHDPGFFLVENEEYGHLDFIKEIGMYCVDDHGNPVDAYNHAMDELRYSINYFVKQYMY